MCELRKNGNVDMLTVRKLKSSTDNDIEIMCACPNAWCSSSSRFPFGNFEVVTRDTNGFKEPLANFGENTRYDVIGVRGTGFGDTCPDDFLDYSNASLVVLTFRNVWQYMS